MLVHEGDTRGQKWETESQAARQEFAYNVHPALAGAHKEANLMDRLAAELRAAVAPAAEAVPGD